MTDIHAPTSQDSLSLQELDLYHLLMAYRATAGLPAIPLSTGLTVTAGRHALDTRDNIWAAGLDLPDGANLHSWSDAPYYGDHRDPAVMWEAPERLGTGYPGAGYEISAAGYGGIDVALGGWQGSPGHDQVIMNQGIWSSMDWRAIGIGVDTRDNTDLPYWGRVYHVWFGTQDDPGGPPLIVDSMGSDRIIGTDFDDRIQSAAGRDLIEAGAGSDVIYLGGGSLHDASLYARNISSDDQVGTNRQLNLDGLTCIDAVIDGGSGAADTIRLSEAGDAFFLHDAYSGYHGDVELSVDKAGRASTARFSGVERIEARGGNDLIDLTSPDYSLAGAQMTIDGGSGDDVIWGSDADETMRGGTGNDTLFAGTGADRMTGGPGADVFEFTRTSGETVVTDFDPGEGDRLVFYNQGGALFDAGSIALTGAGLAIDYLLAGEQHALEVQLAGSAAGFVLTLGEIAGALDIV